MKKYLLIAAPVIVIGLGFWFFKKGHFSSKTSKTQQVKGFDGKVHYQFQKLPAGIIAQAGDQVVKEEEVARLAPMRSFESKRRDVLFAILYKQFISQVPQDFKKIAFSFKKVSLSPSAILNQYGVPEKRQTQISFSAFPENQGLAKVDGKLITEKDVDFNNFIWGAHETAVFRYKLSAVDEILKNKVVNAEAQKLGLGVPAYEKKYIYEKLPDEVSENDIKNYMKKYSIEDTDRNRTSARNNLQSLRKKRGYNYILEKYVMDLPIKVNLPQPKFVLDSKDEWTAQWGDPKGLKVTLFAGTRNSKTVELLRSLLPALKKYPGVQLLYRPYFFDGDRLQEMTSQAHFCVLISNKSKFWDFFLATLGDFRDQTEATLYAKADEVGLDSKSLKQCLVDQKYKDVVDYHIQYAKYIGISSDPVIYVGGEVLYGAIQLADIEKIIQRHLSIPAAGMW